MTFVRCSDRASNMKMNIGYSSCGVWLVTFGMVIAGCQQPDNRPAKPITTAWESPPAQEAPKDAWQPPVTPAEQPPATPTASTQPDAAPAPDDSPIARVGDEPISRSMFFNTLVETHGVDLLEKYVLLAVLKQKAAAAGIVVSDDDVEAEYLDALKRIAAPMATDDKSPFDRAGAERLLNDFLVAKNISRIEFRLRMRQNAYLRKLSEREVSVDDKDLPTEYQRTYGERVKIRCIQMSNPEAVRRVRAALDEGKDFELVARTMSENPVTAANGGLLPPFSRFDDIPKLMRDAAFALQPGQVSTVIQEDQGYCIIRVEAKYPPSQVGVENVKDELRRRIQDRLVRQRMEKMAGELFNSANVEIEDATLRSAYRERYPK